MTTDVHASNEVIEMLGAAADYSAAHQRTLHGAGYWEAMIQAARDGK